MKTLITTMAIYDWTVGMNINLACDVQMYLRVIVYRKYKIAKHIHIDMFKLTWYVPYSLGIVNPCDPLIHDPLIHDPLNTDTHIKVNAYTTLCTKVKCMSQWSCTADEKYALSQPVLTWVYNIIGWSLTTYKISMCATWHIIKLNVTLHN